MRAGEVLRVHGNAPFTLRWSIDNWKTANDSKSTQNALELDHVDLKDAAAKVGTCISFTFLWTEDNRWEGQNYEITVR
jgi:glucoamylase